MSAINKTYCSDEFQGHLTKKIAMNADFTRKSLKK